MPKAKVKARVNPLTKVEARVKKDKAKDAANLKAKKNGLPSLHLPFLPHQPKGKARNNLPRRDDNAKGSSDEEASDSSGSNSDVSSQDDSSDVSDLEKFDEAYADFSALTDGVGPQTC